MIALAILAVLAALWLATLIPRTVTIFIIAAFIAFGVQPVVVFLEQRRVPKPLAISMVFVGLLVAIGIALLIIIPATIEQGHMLASNGPLFVSIAQAWLTNFETWLHGFVPHVDLKATFNIQNALSERLGAIAGGTIASVGTVLVNAASGLFIAVSALVLSFFFLLNDRQVAEGFAQIFPPRRRAIARTVAAEIGQVFGSYIAGQIAVSAITGLVVGVASALVGFQFALILGILTAIAYSVPIIGMLIAQIIALVISAPQGPGIVIWVQVIMFVTARISDSVLVPKIMGSSVGISPIGVMFAVFAGGELFGLPGLILGIPAAALIRILWKYFADPWLQVQWGGDVPAPPAPTSTPAP